MPAARCPICLSHLPVDKFVVYWCGHGFCIDCKSNMFEESAEHNCPNCRLPIHDWDAHPLFLEFVDSESKVAGLVEDLDKMDPETPLQSVMNVGQELTRVLQDPQLAPNDMTALIKAIENFDERLVPLFNKVDFQTHQIIAMRQDSLMIDQETEDLRDQLKKAELKSTLLEIELDETKMNLNEAIRHGEVARDDLDKIHESSLQWIERISELTAENDSYKDALERHNESARLRREEHEGSLQWIERVSELTAENNSYKDMLEKHEESARLQREEQNKLQKETDAAQYEIQHYDGGFSADEHPMIRTRSSLDDMSTSSSQTAFRLQDKNHTGLDVMEYIPPLRFLSDWQLTKGHSGEESKKHVNG